MEKEATGMGLAAELMESVPSRHEALRFTEPPMRATDRKEFSHAWADIADYIERITTAYKGKIVLINWIKGGWYLFKALTALSPAGNARRDVDEGAWTIYLPGYLQIPGRGPVDEFAEILGRKVAYFPSTDVDQSGPIRGKCGGFRFGCRRDFVVHLET